MGVVISLSNGGSTWSCNSTTVVAMPRRTKFSTSSRPMNPAPTTTACLTPWSTRSLMRSTSCRLRSVKIPGKSMPGIGGRKRRRPRGEDQLVVGFLVLPPRSEVADTDLLRRAVDGLDR